MKLCPHGHCCHDMTDPTSTVVSRVIDARGRVPGLFGSGRAGGLASSGCHDGGGPCFRRPGRRVLQDVARLSEGRWLPGQDLRKHRHVRSPLREIDPERADRVGHRIRIRGPVLRRRDDRQHDAGTARSGTEVTILCENIPPGIRPADNEAGCRSTLEKLAAFLDG